MKNSGQSAVFGKRKEPHTVIIARGNEIRHFTVRPWVAAVIGSAISAMAIGYLLATSYLVLRDDLIGAAAARQARMQQAYEDRISALRSQVDRITSRQLLDQRLMESKVSELLQRQSQLTERHGRLAPILQRANEVSSSLPAAAPLPTEKPDERAEVAPLALDEVKVASTTPSPFSLWSPRTRPAPDETSADRADKLFVAINKSLRSIESDQMKKIARLSENASQRADAIATALESAGLTVDSDYGKEGTGGPLIPVDGSTVFDAKVKELDEALDYLDVLKNRARAYPISNPAPGLSVSSSFGVRSDPITGTQAMHSGLDLRAPMGTAAHATAPGTVVKAGWNGGYGRMIEINHGNGFSTRYGHLSKILVKVGQQVSIGQVIGKTGSSGRSTGPHLHYEIRHNGKAVNPVRYLKVGRKLSAYL